MLAYLHQMRELYLPELTIATWCLLLPWVLLMLHTLLVQFLIRLVLSSYLSPKLKLHLGFDCVGGAISFVVQCDCIELRRSAIDLVNGFVPMPFIISHMGPRSTPSVSVGEFRLKIPLFLSSMARYFLLCVPFLFWAAFAAFIFIESM